MVGNDFVHDRFAINFKCYCKIPGRGGGGGGGERGKGRGTGCKRRVCSSAPYGFWSHLGFSGRNTSICDRQGIFYEETIIKKGCLLVGMPFRGRIKLESHPAWSP